MTFREKLAQEHPKRINEDAMGGCDGCPFEYGYEEYDCEEYDCGGGSFSVCEACWNREMPDTPAPMTAEEAWELAKKLFSEFSESQLNEIFGEWWNFSKLMELSPQQAKAKIEEWESKQIRVGDVVESGLIKGVVTAKYPADNNSEAINILRYNGLFAMNQDIKGWKKTGKHIDIQAVLDQIGGGKDE